MLALRGGNERVTGLVFYTAFITLFPFAFGPDVDVLAHYAPALLWLGALLSVLIGIEKLFERDDVDGTLDQFCLSAAPIELVAFVKIVAFVLSALAPLVAISPFLGLFLGLNFWQNLGVALSLVAGAPALCALGALGACVLSALRQGGMLLLTLILPLTIPVVIFGVAAANAFMANAPEALPAYFALCGLSLISLALCPLAMGHIMGKLRG